MGNLRQLLFRVILTFTIGSATLYCVLQQMAQPALTLPVSAQVTEVSLDHIVPVTMTEESPPYYVTDEIVQTFPCDNIIPTTHYGQKGPFFVIYNYVMGHRRFRCDESVTYTTHADFLYLDNVLVLLDRWTGPLSIAMYTPTSDFVDTLHRIVYLRHCSEKRQLVNHLVTFHLFFDQKHLPKSRIPSPDLVNLNLVNQTCLELEKQFFQKRNTTFRKGNKLPYAVNVARNIAREAAMTHFILASDIELYPNPGIVPGFMQMLRRDHDLKIQKVVFVLPIFELDVSVNVSVQPWNKTDLVQLLKAGLAVPFHKYVCPECHLIPGLDDWLNDTEVKGHGLNMNVFQVAQRHYPFQHWEPIFIGTKNDPFYDERLTWEGQSDKMTQV